MTKTLTISLIDNFPVISLFSKSDCNGNKNDKQLEPYD